MVYLGLREDVPVEGFVEAIHHAEQSHTPFDISQYVNTFLSRKGITSNPSEPSPERRR